jgi:hypothetical protein
VSGKIGTFSRASSFDLDDRVTGDESLREQFLRVGDPKEAKPVCTQRQTFQERAAALPQPFSLAAHFVGSAFRSMAQVAKRFPDAAKHFMVAQSLWLLTSNFVKSKACGSSSGSAGLWRAV